MALVHMIDRRYRDLHSDPRWRGALPGHGAHDGFPWSGEVHVEQLENQADDSTPPVRPSRTAKSSTRPTPAAKRATSATKKSEPSARTGVREAAPPRTAEVQSAGDGVAGAELATRRQPQDDAAQPVTRESSGDFSLDLLAMVGAALESGQDLDKGAKFLESALKSHKEHYLRPKQATLTKHVTFLLALAMLLVFAVFMLNSENFHVLASSQISQTLVSAIGIIGTLTLGTLGTLGVAKAATEIRNFRARPKRGETRESEDAADTTKGTPRRRKAA